MTKTDKIISEYLPLVRSIATKYLPYGVPQEDLEQEGLIGLLKAIDNYAQNKGTKFSTYASYWIKKYIIAAIEKETKAALHASKLNEEITQSKNTTETQKTSSFMLPKEMPLEEKRVLTLLYEKQLTLKEIAKEMNISRERVRQLKEKGLRRMRAYMK